MVEIKQIALISAIAFLFTVLIVVSIDAFYPEPEYSEYCGVEDRPYPARPGGVREPDCKDAYNATLQAECSEKDGFITYDYNASGCPVNPTCNTCQAEYEDARVEYNRNVFFITAPIGIAAIIFGILFWLDWLASGFMFGGIAVLAYGTIRYFADMNRYLRVLTLLLELALIVWIGWVYMGPKNTKRKKKSKK